MAGAMRNASAVMASQTLNQWRGVLMTASLTGITKGLSCLGNKFPLITRRVQGEFQNAEGVGRVRFTCRQDRRAKARVTPPARADDELPYPALRIRDAVWSLR